MEAEDLKDEMGALFVQILDNEHGVELFISILMNFNDDFDSQPWTNRSQARTILNSAMKEVMANPNRERALKLLSTIVAFASRPQNCRKQR